MYNIAIRADGSMEIGMGHIMRCISLAKEFEKKGCKVFFFSKNEEGIMKIQQEGFGVVEIKQKGAFENEEIAKLLKQWAIDVLIVDSYDVDEGYFLFLRPYVKKLVYIDDVNKFIYPVDILINGNITGEFMNYQKYRSDEIFLLGPKYNLIRDEFKYLPAKEVKEDVSSIMITTGGSDPFNLCSCLAEWILSETEMQNIKINIIVGSAFTNKEILRELSLRNKKVTLHENIRSMASIMLDSDIAISSGGSTLYELCACGTPTLAFVMADNQEFIVEKMNELKYIESLGWFDKLKSGVFISKIKQLAKDYNKRKEISCRMKELVDGEGSNMVVSEILKEVRKYESFER